MDITEIIMTVSGFLSGGGLGWLLNARTNRRIAMSQADKSQVEARQAEFDLLRQQIELNQQQNIALIEQLGRKEERFADQTARLRDIQRELSRTLDRVMRLTAALNHYRYWHCRIPYGPGPRQCGRRQPPHPSPDKGYVPPAGEGEDVGMERDETPVRETPAGMPEQA